MSLQVLVHEQSLRIKLVLELDEVVEPGIHFLEILRCVLVFLLF